MFSNLRNVFELVSIIIIIHLKQIDEPKNDYLQAQGDTGKPPPGYKCRRCDSTEVRALEIAYTY